MTDSKPSGAKTYRKTATITASQWFKMGDHPAVILKSNPNRYADEGIPWCPTLEGGHIVTAGDWIATGVQGEHWPIKPDVFAATYAESTDEPTQPDPVGYALAIERAAGLCNERGIHEQSQFGLGRSAQNYFRARDAIRALTPPADRLAVVLAMPEVRAALEASYLVGFNSSGEGYNGEYPFQDNSEDPEKDADWLAARSAALAALVQP